MSANGQGSDSGQEPVAAASRDIKDDIIQEAEDHFVQFVVNRMSREEVRERLRRDLQAACEVELATIPIYLFTYYSIKRSQNSGEHITDIDLYANKAGGHIMSVAVEEMLHMSLSANIFFSLFGTAPQLYGKSPASFPTRLPNHKQLGPPGPDGDREVLISLGKLGYEQLWHFLQIETPGDGPLPPTDKNWQTIGQFYSYIRCLIRSSKLNDSDFRVGSVDYQIQPYNYSPNNVDTVSPKKKFNSWNDPDKRDSAAGVADYPNSADSHEGPSQLITIQSREDALLAIGTICDQGEGADHTKWDDKSKQEQSHYSKFLHLQAQFERYQDHRESLPERPEPPALITPTVTGEKLEPVVVNFPDSPKTADYPSQLQPISDFCNALYQYMLIMTETIFHVRAEPGEDEEKQSQKRYFNIALHRSMIWVLDKYILTMRKIPLSDQEDQFMAPTFEFVSLGDARSAFEVLGRYGEAAVQASADLKQGSDIKYYVETAITRTGSGGHPMHLPNVADYLN